MTMCAGLSVDLGVDTMSEYGYRKSTPISRSEMKEFDVANIKHLRRQSAIRLKEFYANECVILTQSILIAREDNRAHGAEFPSKKENVQALIDLREEFDALFITTCIEIERYS